jgi:hypothetical protein
MSGKLIYLNSTLYSTLTFKKDKTFPKSQGRFVHFADCPSQRDDYTPTSTERFVKGDTRQRDALFMGGCVMGRKIQGCNVQGRIIKRRIVPVPQLILITSVNEDF